MDSKNVVYLNGDYVLAPAARISVFDRGFLNADAVYEVIGVLRGRLVDSDAHLARLDRSMRELSIPRPMGDAEFRTAALELLTRNRLDEGIVYCQVSRGPAARDLAYPTEASPTVVMFTQPKSIIANPKATTGIRVISLPDLRWRRRDIKTVSPLAASMARQQALEAGVDDAWLVENGLVTEGCSSNAFIVTTDGVLITRPLDHDVLHGITRRAILSMSQRNGLTIEERAFSLQEAYCASEAFSTSASSFVLPVIEIDGRPIGSGRAGMTTNRLRELYIEFALES